MRALFAIGHGAGALFFRCSVTSLPPGLGDIEGVPDYPRLVAEALGIRGALPILLAGSSLKR
jgi:hypothetical protein